MTKSSIKSWAATFAGAVLLGAGSTGLAMEDLGTTSIGKMEFQKNCASCHGMGGKGDGPLLELSLIHISEPTRH